MSLPRLFAVLIVAVTCGIAGAQRSTPTQVLHASPAANDQFGGSVAIDGDTMVVGSSFDTVGGNGAQGSATVYRWTGTGWTFESTLTASDGATNDMFGNAVAIDGDTIIVGASQDDFGANTNQGSAYVFVRTGSVWVQQAKLFAADGEIADGFGFSVALHGDTAIAGVPTDDVAGISNQGSAYVFVRTGATWSQQAKLLAADGALGDQFGRSVAVSADSAVIGAYQDDVGANANQGSAYVFLRAGAVWSQQAQLVAADGAANDNLGNAVAMVGETVLIAASGDDVGANSNQGSAYVFVRSGQIWSQQSQMTASDGAANDAFGASVALGRNGDTAIIGANADDVGGTLDQGSAYAYARSGGSWSQQAALFAPGGVAFDNFGISVAVSGDTVIIGAYGDDVGANSNQGSAWVFSRLGDKWIGPDLKLFAQDGAATDSFGKSVAIDGDTAIIGAYQDDIGGSTDEGSAYVFVRSGSAWVQQAKLTPLNDPSFDDFGISVALSGNTALIGANGNEGAYVFVRSGSVWTQQARLTPTGASLLSDFGSSVSISGDTAVIGARFDDVASNNDQGTAYVFVRSGGVWSQQARLTASDGTPSDRFGTSVAVSGETILVGAPFDGTATSQGAAYVYVRGGSTWAEQARLVASDGAPFELFGIAVALSGDTAVAGAVGFSASRGAAYVFQRSGNVWSEQAKLLAPNGAAGDHFGTSVSVSGDTAAIGAFRSDIAPNMDQGAVYVFGRLGNGWTPGLELTAIDGLANEEFGTSVAISAGAVLVGIPQRTVGGNAGQGGAWSYDVSSEDSSSALNDVTKIAHSSLASALLFAQSGQQIAATEAAWREIGSLNTLGRSLALTGSGDIRTPSTSTLELGGSSVLAASSDGVVELNGQLRVSTSASADVSAGSLVLGSRGVLTARTGSSLTLSVPAVELDGQTRLEQGAALTFAGSATAIGSTTCNVNASLTAGGTFTNIDTFTITAGTISAPLFDNRSAFNVFGASAVFGAFTNQAGSVTTIRSGTLYVFGSLTNGGTIVGTLCSNCLATPPNLDVGGDLSIGSSANLNMPFVGSLVHVGGDFDCAIDSQTRFDLSLATLQLEGASSEQTLEVMSRDIGPSMLGLDRTLAGHYPIGTLEIGPTPCTVRLIDVHDNDLFGQSSCEAVYVDTLHIAAGCRLVNTTCKIYYNTLVNSGVIDAPANVIPIAPACSADFDDNGSVSVNDLFAFLGAWFAQNGGAPGSPSADFDDSGTVSVNDLFAFLGAWFAQNGVCG